MFWRNSFCSGQRVKESLGPLGSASAIALTAEVPVHDVVVAGGLLAAGSGVAVEPVPRVLSFPREDEVVPGETPQGPGEPEPLELQAHFVLLLIPEEESGRCGSRTQFGSFDLLNIWFHFACLFSR